jgi:hypothetical protein
MQEPTTHASDYHFNILATVTDRRFLKKRERRKLPVLFLSVATPSHLSHFLSLGLSAWQACKKRLITLF